MKMEIIFIIIKKLELLQNKMILWELLLFRYKIQLIPLKRINMLLFIALVMELINGLLMFLPRRQI
jgi:hypothetical protein